MTHGSSDTKPRGTPTSSPSAVTNDPHNPQTQTAKHLFEDALERTRVRYGLYIYSYVIMPENVHLLLSNPKPVSSPALSITTHFAYGIDSRTTDT